MVFNPPLFDLMNIVTVFHIKKTQSGGILELENLELQIQATPTKFKKWNRESQTLKA